MNVDELVERYSNSGSDRESCDIALRLADWCRDSGRSVKWGYDWYDEQDWRNLQ